MTYQAQQTNKLTEASVQADPTASVWLKRQLFVLARRDLLDSLTDIETLNRIFSGVDSAQELTGSSHWLRQQIKELRRYDALRVMEDLQLLLKFAKQRYERVLSCRDKRNAMQLQFFTQPLERTA